MLLVAMLPFSRVMLRLQVSLADGKLQLDMRDAAQLYGGSSGAPLHFVAGDQGAHFMLIELAASDEAPEL